MWQMSLATRLKRLREAAEPSITIRDMAARLGLDHSTYAHYENPKRFKKPHLPLDLARRIATILKDHGIAEDDVMALAGIGELEAPDLSASEEMLLDTYRSLDTEQRKLLLQLADAMAVAHTAPPPNTDTLHVPRPAYRERTTVTGRKHPERQELSPKRT